MRIKKYKTSYVLTLLLSILTMTVFFDIPAMAGDTAAQAENIPDLEVSYGGGYAVTGQIANSGYSSKIYDATNGLPTSDANYILCSRDGYIWIAGYSGIIRYDGTDFVRMDTAEGLTSGRGLFEDSQGRIWVGTNDNGVVMIDGLERTHFTYKDGLPSSSIRVFSEDNDGSVYIGTTAGVCYVDRDLSLHIIDDKRLNEARVLRLDSDDKGVVYGQTKNGYVFKIVNQELREIYKYDELGMDVITSILADPNSPGNVYICTDSGFVFYGKFGANAKELKRIPVSPLTDIHWISHDCNRIWVASTTKMGYLDEENVFHLVGDIPVDSGIEMMTSDYQGNMWFASSTQGVMKIVTNNFVDITKKASLPDDVCYATGLYHGDLYVGTDNGLKVIEPYGYYMQNDMTAYVGGARVRCISPGNDDDLWVGTYTKDLGLIHRDKNGTISNFTVDNGMPSNEVRCITPLSDGRVLAGTNLGLAFINEGRIIRRVDYLDGIKNTVFLTVEEGLDGRIYVGTDGDGIYIIDGPVIKKIGRDEGLTSDVVVRIKRDEKRNVLWVVTSNSIQYIKDGKITHVTSFPYNNNYDLYFDDKDDMWITSSYGLYMVKAEAMIEDAVNDYRLYTVDNGLVNTPTSLSFSALSDDGYLYIPGRTGVCKVNINGFIGSDVPIKVAISSIYCGSERIEAKEDGSYVIPASGGRIRISPTVLDYSLLNPKVKVYLEGKEEEGIFVTRSDLQPLEYTGLDYGSYKLHLKVLDNTGRKEILDETYSITKKPRVMENPVVRLGLMVLVASAAGFIVWRVMKGTVVSRQYEEIRKAKEEAEKANAAKSSFLANMSHEIRTPINTILGMNEMTMREDATGVPKPYYMSMMNYAFDIRNASEALLSLINDLLDISKIESGKMNLVEQEYDTQDMLRSIVSMIRGRSTEKELTFDVVVDEILPKRLYGDQGKIKQIVLNLLTNAVKYTEKGGFALSVSMDERQDDECKVTFSVKDTGIGVRQEDMDKLFMAYERLDEQKNSGIQGTGLGLDISRRFAEMMGGSLTCVSEYGKGSEFILTLTQKIVDRTPLGLFMEHEDTSSSGPYVPQFVAPDADILVVDDNPMNLSVIKGLLKATRVFISTAESGEECLEKIKDTSFDIVLLDHMMPGMDGVETLAEIRKDHPDLPVYALTANTTLGEDFYTSKGFNGYLSKPIDSLTLEKTIMKHLPEEIMEKPTEEDAVEELKEIPENLKWIYDVEGLMVAEGIRNSGGVSSYLFGLNLFLDTMESNARIIRDAYDSGNIRLYTIKVHSLKSSARLIGALELSRLAEELENAGNSEDMGFIEYNTGKLLTDYEAFGDKLSRLQEEEDSSDKEMIPEDELKEAYSALCDVIPQMDYDSVEMILDQLKEYALPKEDEARIKELSKMLKLFDWEGMEALIKDQ